MTNLREEGFLQQVRGRLRSAWGELTDDDMDKAGGNFEKLVGIIKEKTGQTEDAIRGRLDQIRHETTRRP